MRALFMGLSGAMLAVLAIFGDADTALQMGLALAIAEIFSLCAAEMYYIAAGTEVENGRRAQLGSTAMLLAVCCLVGLVPLCVITGMPWGMAAVGVAYALLRVQLERARLGYGRSAVICAGALASGVVLLPLLAAVVPVGFDAVALCGGIAAVAASGVVLTVTAQPGMRAGVAKPSAAIFRALPEAMASRALYLIPAAALLAAAWQAWHVNTLPAYAAGLIAFSLLRTDSDMRGADLERFGVRWLPGGVLTGLCVLLGWNGVFSAVYCAWGVIVALLPVRHGGAAWLCALLVVLQAVCGWLGCSGVLPVLAAAGIAFALVLLMIPLQRRAIYAAWLPVRAWAIRRRAAK